MAYTKTNWVDNTTPVDAARMNNIENGIAAFDTTITGYQPTSQKNQPSGYVGLDASKSVFLDGSASVLFFSAQSAAGNAPLRTQLSGDSQPRWLVRADGKQEWGPGGSTSLDTALYRASAGSLRTDGNLFAGTTGGAGSGLGVALWGAGALEVVRGSAASNCFDLSVTGDAQVRFQALADGTLKWGPGGSTVPDTNLYRASAGVIRMNGASGVGVFLDLLNDTNTSIRFGPAATSDTSLYRVAGGVLSCNQHLLVPSILYLGEYTGNAPNLMMAATGVAGVRYNSLATWGTMYAAAFTVQSDRTAKSNIKGANDKRPTMHDALMTANLYEYERHGEDTGEQHLGLMAEELPDEVVMRKEAAPPKEGENTDLWREQVIGVDIYKLATALLGSVQLLNERIAALEGATPK